MAGTPPYPQAGEVAVAVSDPRGRMRSMTEMTIATEGFLDETLQLVRDAIDALIDEGPSSPDPVQWSMLCGECLDIADELLIAGAVDLKRSPRSSRTFQSPTPPGRDDRPGPSARARAAFASVAGPRESCRRRDAAGRRVRPVRCLTRLSPTSSRWPNGSPTTSRTSRQGALPAALWRSSSWRPGQLWPPRRNVSSPRLGSRCRRLHGRHCCRPFPSVSYTHLTLPTSDLV